MPAPVAGEVDGLRRGLGDGALGRIRPHLTLVPPVNVREDDVEAALDRLRSAAATTGHLRVTLGPVSTFHPVTPTLYLAVEGDLDSLGRLRDAAFAPPLARELTHPFTPHVTVADDAPPARIAAAVEALAGFRADVTFDRLTLLEEHRRDDGVRVWEVLADAALGERSRHFGLPASDQR